MALLEAGQAHYRLRQDRVEQDAVSTAWPACSTRHRSSSPQATGKYALRFEVHMYALMYGATAQSRKTLCISRATG